jgi:monoamine oxidase
MSGEVISNHDRGGASAAGVVAHLAAMLLELGASGTGSAVRSVCSSTAGSGASSNGEVLSDRAWGHLWETTDDQSGDRGVLTNLLSSHDGAAFAALPEAPDRIVAEIDRLFPGAKGLAGERVHTDWTNDPFSLGAYSCFGPGQIAPAASLLTAAHGRDGRLLLAGEHTDEFSGFMEGALRSGARVAAKIVERRQS